MTHDLKGALVSTRFKTLNFKRRVQTCLSNSNMSSRYSPAASGLPAVIGGLLGLEFLSKFEVEFDFVNKAMKFHSPGCIKCGALARACMCVHATRHSLDFGLRRGKYVFNTCFSLVFERLKAVGVKARFTVRYGDANRAIDEPCASDVSQLVEICSAGGRATRRRGRRNGSSSAPVDAYPRRLRFRGLRVKGLRLCSCGAASATHP